MEPQVTESQRVDGDDVATHERAAVTLDSIGDAVLSTDVAGTITYLNRAAEAMTGWSQTAAAGRPLEDVFHIIDRATRKRAQNPMVLALQLHRTVGLTPNCLLVRRDGREVAIEDSAAPIQDRDGQITGAVVVFRDVGAALEMSRQMSYLAQHDVLTGLPNRMLLGDRLTEAIALRRRHQKTLAVCFLDVDRFKDVNDTVGHAGADQVLQSMATRLSSALRQSDTVCRYGGDEFVVVLSEIAKPEHAVLVARKLLQSVAEPYHLDRRTVGCTVSLGVSLFPDHGDNADRLIANADAAMYESKRRGSGNYRVFEVDSLKTDRAITRWEGEGGATRLAPLVCVSA
jgi:diguanylate cyclase (GGDEF)-like protein/PAS domain S-box-containing protein